jgi:autotransporter-associated beta strand protein
MKTRYLFLTVTGLVLGLLLTFGQNTAQAALTWDPTTGTGTSPTRDGAGNWDTTTLNWWNGSADVAYTTNDVVFGNGGAAATVTVVTAPGMTNLTFNAFSNAYTFDASGGLGLFLYGNLTMNSGAGPVTFNPNVKPTIMANSTWDIESTNALTVSAPLNGSFNFTKVGPGTLTLAGQGSVGGAGNTFLLQGGVLNLNNAKAIGIAATTLQIENGTAIGNTSAGAITLGVAYPITINGDFAFNGPQNLIASTTSPTTLGTAAGTSRTITVNSGTLMLAGPIANGTTANSIIKAGNGALATASTTAGGASTFTGGVTLNAGTLNINAAGLAGTSGPLGNGGTLTINGGAIDNGSTSAKILLNVNPITVAADFAFGGSQNLTLPGAVTLTGNRSLTANASGILTLTGAIGDGGNGYSLTKLGTGALALSGANTFTGGVTLGAGTLNINAAGVAGTSGPLGNGGRLTINGGTIDNTSGSAKTLLNVNPITIGGDFGFSTAAGTANNNLSLPGAVSLTGNRTITNNGTGVLTLGGVISDGGNGYALTKQGTGTLLLTNVNTYSGNTTIGAGTLALGANGSINNTPTISIAAGGTFDVSTIASYAWSGSTSLSASGAATAANIKGASGGSVNLGSRPITLTYNGTNPALTISQGTLSLNGNAFTVNGSPLANGSYIIIQQATGSIVSNGTFTVTGTAISGSHVGAIQVSGGSVNLIVSSTVAVDHFAITGISSPQTAGTAITGFTITAQDAGNATVTGYNGFVTFGGTAGGTGTSPAFVNGVCTTASVTPTVSGTGTITVADSSVTGTTTITVNPGAVSQFVIAPNPIASATAGTPFALTSITARDAFSNICSNGPNAFTGTVGFSGTAGVTGTSASFTAGVLTSPSVTATNAGSIVVTNTGGSVTGTATLTTILPGPAQKITLNSGNSQSGIAGTALASPFVVTVTDTYGHPVPGTNVTFAIATTPGGATGQALSTNTVSTDANGQAATILTLGDTAGTYTVTATSGTLVGSPVTFTATAALAGPPIVKAATGTDLTTGTSWTGGTAPDASYVAAWDSSSLCPGLTIGSATTWNGISVGSAVSDIGITGAGQLTVGLGGIDMSASTINLSVGTPVAFAGSQTWNVNVAKTLTVSGNISGGAFTLTKLGQGTVTLSGSNTFSGGLKILNGTVALSSSNSIGSGLITLGDSSGGAYVTLKNSAAAGSITVITNPITVAAGSSGVLTIQGGNNYTTNTGNLGLNNNLTTGSANSGKSFVFSGVMTETSAGSPALTVSSPSGGTSVAGPPTFAGGVVVGSGGLTFAHNSSGGTFTVGPGNITSTTGGSVTFNANSPGLFTVSAASINNAGNITNSGTGSGATTISGNIGGNVTNVVQNSSSSLLTLSGSNTFSGGLYILNGTVSATISTNALGAGSVYLGDTGGTASATLLGDARTFPNPITVQSGSSGALSIGNSGNNAAVFNGNIAQNSPLALFAGGTGSVQLGGGITGTNQITIDATNAAGYVSLAGNSPNFTGSVLVDTGVLRIGSTNSLNASNSVMLNAGSILDVQNSVTIAGLQDGIGAGYVTNRSSNARTLTLGGSGTYSFSGTIADNSTNKATSLVKLGSGNQTLSGANTYTGNTTVGGGTLAISQATLATNSTITVSNGGVLQLDFTVTNSVAALVLNGITVTGVHNNSTDPTYLHGSGSLLALSSPIATNPTNISFTVSGNSLNLTWPADHLGWMVQSNSVDLTVPANWHTISNTAAGTNFSITIDPAKTNVFYRLLKP